MKNSIELISIGTELLSGRTLNSHAQTLGAALTIIGLQLSRDTTIPDGIELIQSAVREAFERVDIVIVSGGLGPTSDDITREALADLFDRKIVLSASGLEEIKKRYAARGYAMNPASERMAQILDGAETLINSAGAAAAQRLGFPGIGKEKCAPTQSVPSIGKEECAPTQSVPSSGKTLFIVPGPPNEFAAVLQDHIAPWLCEQFPEAAPLELRVLTTQGIGESDIVTRLEAANFQALETAIGFYPGFGKVEIRLTAPTEKLLDLETVERHLRELLHGHLID